MEYRRITSRPELLCDQHGHCVVDPDGNYIGWDGPILPDGSNLSTRNPQRIVAATRTEDSRRL
jgi:hypothetical protein